MKDSSIKAIALAMLCALGALSIAPAALADSGKKQPGSGLWVDAELLEKLIQPNHTFGEPVTRLNVLEARTSVNGLPGDADWTHIITQPGSYMLSSNVKGDPDKGGILIDALGVTLDLNGFSVIGGEQTEERNGIEAGDDAKITNGFIKECTGIGIRGDNGVAVNDVSVSFHDPAVLSQAGIRVAFNAQVDRCRVSGLINDGISVGSGSHVTDCTTTVWGTGFGTGGPGLGVLGPGVRFEGCTASNGRSGFAATSGQLVDCVSSNNEEYGFYVNSGSHLIRCLSVLDGTKISDTSSSDAAFRARLGASLDHCVALFSGADSFLIEGAATLTKCVAKGAEGSGFRFRSGGADRPDGVTAISCEAIGGDRFGFHIAGPHVTLRGCISKDNTMYQIVVGWDKTTLDGCHAAVTERHADAGDRCVRVANTFDIVVQDCVFDTPFEWMRTSEGTIRGNRFNSTVSIEGFNTLIVQNFVRGGQDRAEGFTVIDNPDEAGPWSNLGNVSPHP